MDVVCRRYLSVNISSFETNFLFESRIDLNQESFREPHSADDPRPASFGLTRLSLYKCQKVKVRRNLTHMIIKSQTCS